jgi:hypothetical protein
MPSLRDVQQAMRRSLLHDAVGQAAAHIVGAGLKPKQRLHVYRNTLFGTLANALRLSFPAVHRLVGVDFFEGAAQVFAREQPPRCADLNAYGAQFPHFLQRFEPAATLAYLADVARLEWAVNRALHAPDVPALDLSTLAAVAPADHDRVRFVAHPSVSLLRSNFPVDAVWRAVLSQDAAAMAAVDLGSGPAHLLVQRRGDDVVVERLDEGAWRFATALLGGQAVGDALHAASDVDASALLAQHLLAGRCIAFDVAARETAP